MNGVGIDCNIPNLLDPIQELGPAFHHLSQIEIAACKPQFPFLCPVTILLSATHFSYDIGP
jgi:hypothetical protein